MSTDKISEISCLCVREILDEGLHSSTFKTDYPEAYSDLLDYREDIARSIDKILRSQA